MSTASLSAWRFPIGARTGKTVGAWPYCRAVSEAKIASHGGRPYRRLTTAETRLAALVVALVGVGLLYWTGRDDIWKTAHAVQSVVRELGALLIVSVALAMLWDLAGKRTFRDEILETTRLASDIEATGLVRAGARYLSDVEWHRMLGAATKLDVFVAYGRTWRNTYLAQLQALAAKRDGRIRVYLPDPKDTPTMAVLAARFRIQPEELVAAIYETESAFTALARPNGAVIEIYHRPGDRLFSCYRIDNSAVITLYSHSGERLTNVPTLVCQEPGTMYEFVRDDLKVIHAESSLVSTTRTEGT